LRGTPGLPTSREEFDNPSVAVVADCPAQRLHMRRTGGRA